VALIFLREWQTFVAAESDVGETENFRSLGKVAAATLAARSRAVLSRHSATLCERRSVAKKVVVAIAEKLADSIGGRAKLQSVAKGSMSAVSFSLKQSNSRTKDCHVLLPSLHLQPVEIDSVIAESEKSHDLGPIEQFPRALILGTTVKIFFANDSQLPRAVLDNLW
jgi:hypothetical protein